MDMSMGPGLNEPGTLFLTEILRTLTTIPDPDTSTVRTVLVSAGVMSVQLLLLFTIELA